MSEVLEGEVILRRHAHGRVEVLQAPPAASISLALLAEADRFLIRVNGNRISLAGQVAYRVVGWDPQQSALLLEREAPGLTDTETAVAAWPPGAGTRGA